LVSPDGLAAQACGWIASGAQIVGGCCGTTPEHVRALAALRAATAAVISD
jgi:methionine synthase I (cobalamin-dependent)